MDKYKVNPVDLCNCTEDHRCPECEAAGEHVVPGSYFTLGDTAYHLCVEPEVD